MRRSSARCFKVDLDYAALTRPESRRCFTRRSVAPDKLNMGRFFSNFIRGKVDCEKEAWGGERNISEIENLRGLSIISKTSRQTLVHSKKKTKKKGIQNISIWKSKINPVRA
ncbi:hypothetical protein PUN28_000919 [Cardiocondyla obscurior]|uniref:Uncharacterized protein n=1 Tax=Cardiocondyla obscurior TaxID=286306 RepID=A0AAW2H1U6_9HYME